MLRISDQNRRILAEGLALAMLLNLYQIWVLYKFGGNSPKSFSDWDEPLYLTQALQLGEEFLANGYSHWIAANVRSLPHQITGVVVGVLAAVAGLRPVELGLLLDLLCVFSSYVIFTNVFFRIAKNLDHAKLATLIFLALPWVAPLGKFYVFQFLNGTFTGHWGTIGTYPCQPVLRATYTQLSYPLMGCAMLAALNRKHAYLISGILSGLLIYVYFYSWVASTCVIVCIHLVCPTDSENQHFNFRQAVLKLLVFGIANLLVAAGAIVPLLNAQSSYSAEIVGGGGATSAELIVQPDKLLAVIVCVGLLIFLKRRKSELRNLRIVISLFCGILIADSLVFNIQEVIGAYLAAYHFPVFYFHPIYSALLILSVFSIGLSDRIRSISTVAILLFAGLLPLRDLYKINQLNKQPNDFETAIQVLNDSTVSDSVIATLPYEKPFSNVPSFEYDAVQIPHWVWALTGRVVLGNDGDKRIPGIADRDRMLRTEFLLGWIFSGELQLIGACPPTPQKSTVISVTDADSLVYSARFAFCERAKSLLPSITLCKLLKEFRIDYVLWQPGSGLAKSAQLKAVTNRVWLSPNSDFELLQFKYEDAVRQHCGTS